MGYVACSGYKKEKRENDCLCLWVLFLFTGRKVLFEVDVDGVRNCLLP